MKPPEKVNSPTTFRLPQSGCRDPHFGLTRSFYYAAEAEGQLNLVRLKKRGNQRGVTLVPYDAVMKLLNTEMNLSEEKAFTEPTRPVGHGADGHQISHIWH